MSAYKKIKTEFRSFASLLKALNDLGYRPDISNNHFENSLSLYGYKNDIRPETAAIRIPRQQVGTLSNDVGFFWNGSEYEAIISDFDRSAKNRFDVEKQNSLKQRYAVNESIYLANLHGYSVEEVHMDDGTIQIVCTDGGY